MCKYKFQTIFTSTIRCLTYPSFTTYYKSYMFSFVNLLIIARPTKRCIIVRDFSFDWQSLINVSHIWSFFFCLIFWFLVTFSLKMWSFTFFKLYSRSPTQRNKESKSATGSRIFTVYHHSLPCNLDIFH